MADYNIEADITANTKGYEAGIKKAQESTKKFSTSLSKVIQGLGKNGLVGAMGSIGLASAGLSATLGAVVKIARNVSKAIDECTEAYKKQNIAEISLKTAMQNNPLTNGQGTKQLREFASEMQRTSNMGDEELIPFMTQLIASGRTEAETMKIIKTASDMASSGAMSFDTAVTQLNATLNGNIGRLGQQNAELKGLTEEELKNGKAVDILAEKYKGLTEATVDTKKQLQNAIGDLRESFGTVFEKALSPMRTFFAEIIQGWADARKAKQEYEGAVQAVTSGNADIEQLQIVIDANQKKLEDFNKVVEQKAKEYKKDREEILANWIMYLTSEEMEKYTSGDLFGPKQAQEIERQNTLLQGRIRVMKKVADAEEKVKQKRAEGEKAEAERLEREKQLAEMQDKYLKKIAEQEARWNNIESVTGETVKAEEKINFYQNAIVDTLSEANGQIDVGNELFEEQVKIIDRLRAGLDPEQKKTGNDWEKKLREQLIARLEADKEEKLAEVENSKMASWQKEQVEVNYNEQLKKLKLEALEIEEQEALKSVEDLANAEEEKSRIRKYYENERMDLIVSYAKENKKAGEISAQSFANGFKSVVKKLQPILKEIGKVLSSIGNIAKSMFQGGVSIFSKLFNIDLDTVLDTILKIEDKVLTFFVETLPRLPQFVASVMQSISVMLQSVLSVITPEKIAEIITNIMNVIQEQAPAIIEAIGEILSNLLQGLIASAPEMFETLNIIIDKLTEVLPSLIEKITEGIVSLMPSIMKTLANVVEGIAEIIPQLVQSLIDVVIAILKNPEELARIVVAIIKGFVEIVNVLLKNIGPILEALLPAIGKIIIEIIKAIPDILASMAEALWEAVKGIGKFIVNMIIDILNLMFDGISKAWTWIPGTKGIPHIPKLATGTDNAQRGIALVGEAGPELVRFNGGEQVLNNRNTQKALAGIGNSGNTFNVTFNNTMDTTAYAMMSQLRQYNRVMAINGVI